MRPLLAVLLLPALASAGENALDFANGALLLSESGSYGIGMGEWAAWRLTDGSEDHGWCSPQGKPRDATFVWELDTTWKLDMLVLSTRHLQESQYPGISARTVELAVHKKGGAWTPAGRFTIGKDERKELPLPKGTEGDQIRLVVLDNQGNAEYTELAEVEVIGQRAAATATANVAGDYHTSSSGPLRLVQDGDQVFGCYDWAGVGYVWGNVTGRVAQVTWSQPEGQPPRDGTATFSVAGDGRLWGVWFERGEMRGDWSGPRVPKEQGPKCVPQRKGRVADALKRQGKVVLYGIRFDTASDVPRPESSGTLEELYATLAAQKDQRVEIAGHTDAVGNDAANVDLSNRRAKSVVAWLVKKGIDAKRLTAKGYGRSQPVADNATTQGRALNRRVEVTVVK